MKTPSLFSRVTPAGRAMQARLAMLKDARHAGLGWYDALRVSGHPAMQGGLVTLGGKISVSAYITDDRTLVSGAAIAPSKFITSADAAWLIASGIAAGQADKCWGDQITVTTGATAVHDLATGGTLVDSAGASVVIVKLRAIVLAANGIAGVANTTTLTLTRPAANGVPIFSAASGAAPPLSAGGIYVWADPGAGVTVTAATADLINIVNSAGASAGALVIYVGTSA